MKFIKHFLITILILGIAYLTYQHKDTTLVKGEEPFYVGSNTCKECHAKKHTNWHDTSHRKIFKVYTDDSQIIADFKNKPEFVNFEKEDIELIIGFQWEQVFAREIDGEYYPFPAKWMELTKQWVPYKTDKWHKTPLTQKCNGCHTTGLNKQTGDFVEYGVGCESCHGPGSLHVQNKKILHLDECRTCHNSGSLKEELEKQDDITVSIKPAVCGQCHSRGVENTITTHQTEVQFNFPVEYLPGQELSNNFKPTTPQTDAKGKNWWGNGISKNRHQEYSDFAKSDHSKSLRDLKLKTAQSQRCTQMPNDSCLKCHSGDYILAPDDKKPTLETATQGITCVVCHNPHKVGNQKAEDKCKDCHIKDSDHIRGQGKHYPCPTNEVKCVDCHMPKIVKTGGKFSLRSHAFKIIPPEATKKYKMPSSCQNGGCHSDKSVDWMIEEYNKYYKDREFHKGKMKTLSEIVKEIK